MTHKTKGFVKYGVFIVIIAAILGGCKDKDKPTPTDPATGNTVKETGTTTTSSVNTQRDAEKNEEARPERSEIQKIAASAKGWTSVLRTAYGNPAPNMILKDITGKQISVTALKGKNTVIIRWASNHEPAVQMLKTLADLQNEIGAKDLAIIGISSEDPAIIKPIAESMGIKFPLIGRPHRLVSPYRAIRETPSCFFIDKTGNIQLITLKKIPADTVKAILKAM
jgi:peroxiredoxin